MTPPAQPSLHVTAGILWRDGLYLAAQRPPGKILAGFWEFPGGKVEAGENAADALERELLEELAVRAPRLRFWQSLEHTYHDRPDQPVVLHFFHVPEFDGEPMPQEGQTLRWVSPQQGLELEFLPADIPIVRALAQVGHAGFTIAHPALSQEQT